MSLAWLALPQEKEEVPDGRRDARSSAKEAPTLSGHPTSHAPPASDPGTGPTSDPAPEPAPVPASTADTLQVRVEWPDGEPRGRTAEVGVYLAGGRILRCVTDGEGVAVFENVPAGDVTLSARAEPPLIGLSPWTVQAGVVDEAVVSLGEGVLLEGHVLDARTGAPVEGALVGTLWAVEEWVHSRPGPPPAPTDADGRYETWWAPAGPKDFWEFYQVVAVAPGHALGLAPFPEVARDVHRVTLDFRLDPGGTVRGVVRRPDGGPARGALVAAMPQHDARARRDPWCRSNATVWLERLYTARADDEGRYLVRGIPFGGVYAVTADAEGFGRAEEVANVAPSATRPDVVADLTLREGATLRFQVVDPIGRPIAGARVRSRGPDDEDGESTDERGIVRVEDPEPGQWRVRVKATGWREARTEIDLAYGAAVEHTIVLTRGAAIEGVVLDEAGRPLAGVLVDANALDGKSRGTARTHAMGRFRIRGLAPGPHRLGVRTERGSRLGGEGAEATAPARDVVVAVVRRGHIVLEIPVTPGVDLSHYVRVEYLDGETGCETGACRTRTADGRAWHYVVDVPSGQRVFEIRLPGWAPFTETVDVPPGDHVVVPGRLDPGLDLVGRVVDRQGRPVADARLYAHDHEQVEARTDANGRYALRHLAPGRVVFSVGTLDQGFLVRTLEHEVVPGGEALEITLLRGGRIGGHLRDARGFGVAGVHMIVRNLDHPDVTRWNVGASTDAVGAFDLHVHAGRYEVGLWDEAASTFRPLVEVEVADEGAVAIELTRP